MGLQLLERENEVFKVNNKLQPQLAGHDYILARQLKPEARTDMKQIFEDLKIKPTSMIDISDGLSSEIKHICKESHVGAKIYEDKILLDNDTKNMALEFNINPLVTALNGGEDYELLFTVSLEDYDKIVTMEGVAIVGHMTKPELGLQLVGREGEEIELQAQGWNSLN